MQRFAIYTLLGPALVFYMIADVASARGRLDAYGYLVAAVAIALSFARRHTFNGDARARNLLGWLGVSAAVAVLRLLNDETPRLWTSYTEVAALAFLGALVVDLALTMPDPLGGKRVQLGARVASYMLAAITGVLSCIALGPYWELFGDVWLLPARYANSSALFSALALIGALAIRIARRRIGTSQEALSSNTWALIGLVPATLLGPLCALGLPPSAAWVLRAWGIVSVLALYAGHVCLIDSRRRLSVTPSTRDGMAAALTVAVAAVSSGLLSSSIPSAPLARGLWVAGTLFLSLCLYLALRPRVRYWFAPDAGRLLDALAVTQLELGRAQTLERLMAIALGGLRAAAGGGQGRPIIYGFEPAFEGHIDAAGAPHLSERPPHPMLLARLRDQPGDLVVRADLELQMVRQPTVRPLVDALLELDALCVVPLVVESELEGALLLPRGDRHAPLSAEEQRALWELARQLAGLLAVFSAKARAEQRANLATLASAQAKSELDTLSEIVQRLRTDIGMLQSGRSLQAEARTMVAYSASQRALLAELKTLAQQTGLLSLSLVAETGIDVTSVARYVHAQSARADEPFVIMDCAAIRADHAAAALFGGDGPLGHEVGCLRVVGDGTLLLLDCAALPMDVQQKLALALVARRAEVQHSEDSYSVGAHLIVSVCDDVVGLANQGRFAAELADLLSEAAHRVPSLRECREDISSLVLLAIDRACRSHGRGPVGIETDALAQLVSYDFPGNQAELAQLIERAVAEARGIRLTLADIVSGRGLVAKPGEEALQGTLEEIEHRALAQALQRAGNNKSEAARLLAIPRTTLLDKLRRHKLDEPPAETPRPN